MSQNWKVAGIWILAAGIPLACFIGFRENMLAGSSRNRLPDEPVEKVHNFVGKPLVSTSTLEPDDRQLSSPVSPTVKPSVGPPVGSTAPSQLFGFLEDEEGNIKTITTNPNSAQQDSVALFGTLDSESAAVPEATAPDGLTQAVDPVQEKDVSPGVADKGPGNELPPAQRAETSEPKTSEPANLDHSTSQAIMEIRSQLGGGLSSVFQDADLKKVADEAFQKEVRRLDEIKQNQDPGVPLPGPGASETNLEPTSNSLVPIPDGLIPPVDIPPSIATSSQLDNVNAGVTNNGTPATSVGATFEVARKARRFARELDNLANELEDERYFELADRLRTEAQQLRKSVRH